MLIKIFRFIYHYIKIPSNFINYKNDIIIIRPIFRQNSELLNKN